MAGEGGITVDSNGVVRTSGGARIEGIERHADGSWQWDHPVITDEDGKVNGIDMTVGENRRRHHDERSGIPTDDRKELEGRLRNPKQSEHKAFLHDPCMKRGKRWKYEAKSEASLDPNEVHDTPKFRLGSVMVERGENEAGS